MATLNPNNKNIISILASALLILLITFIIITKKSDTLPQISYSQTPTPTPPSIFSNYPKLPYLVFNYQNQPARLYVKDIESVPTFTDDTHIRQKLFMEISNNPIIYPIYEVSTDSARGFETIQELYPSPDGQYLLIGLTGYEWSSQKVIKLPEGKILSFPYDIMFNLSNTIWSKDNNLLVVNGYHDAFGGEGTPGLYVSDFGNREKLNQVRTFSETDYNFCGRNITNISITPENQVSFTEECNECNGKPPHPNDGFACSLLPKIQKFLYNPKTEKLEKL